MDRGVKTSGDAMSMRSRLLLGTAFMTSAFIGGYRGYVRRAFADCVGAAGTYTCSGVTTTQQLLTGAPLVVTTAPGFSINTAASDALHLVGTGGLSFTDNYASAITASGSGIHAANTGSGALTITATGTVTGDLAGIYANNDTGTGTLTINAATVSSQAVGIYAEQHGTGALAITATGTVTGTSEYGIHARNYTGTDLTINAVDVSGYLAGIHAIQDGTGVLTITTTGTVTGTGPGPTSPSAPNGIGIYARSSAGTGITINSANVSGVTHGIYARDNSAGALSITATGTVTATNLDGIFAYSAPSTTSQTIDVAAVSGGRYGINANHRGSGALSITAAGTVEGTSADGIRARNNLNGTDLTIAAATVSGGDAGIDADNYGTGVLSITATGSVTGVSGNGIDATAMSTSTGLTIQATDVSGGYNGIIARGFGSGALSITATGTVTGTAGAGIVGYTAASATDQTINAATVSGALYGIYGLHHGSGTLSITTTGPVTGSSATGISAKTYAGAGGITINAADVSGNTIGIYADAGGSGAVSITSIGTVAGTAAASGTGIRAQTTSAGTTLAINAVDVSGAGAGIDARHAGTGALSITTTGTVTSSGGNGIYGTTTNAASTGLTISAVNVSGANIGIGADHYGTGTLAITATGAVTGSGTNISAAGIYAVSRNGTDLTIDAVDVNGGYRGVRARNYGTGTLAITATGTVTGTSGDGIYARSGASGTDLTIEAVDVSGGTYGILARNDGTGVLSITTSGTVTGSNGVGIRASNSGLDLTIDAADVGGGTYGIDARNYGTGALSVATTGTVTGSNGAGISAVNNSGTDLTINAADVSGIFGGINARNYGAGALSVTTTGNVTGTNSKGIYAVNANGAGLTINAADVSGYDGIYADHRGSGALSITATGTVTGSGGKGIRAGTLAASTDLTIQAATVSGGYSGIYANHSGTGTLAITATGTVTGSGTSNYAAGIYAASYNGTDITIDALSVSGDNRGIQAKNYGTGVLAITTTGPVTGTAGAGINALTGASSTELTIDAVDVSGGTDGIHAYHLGTGAVTVSATGTVTGNGAAGIFVGNDSAAPGSTTSVIVDNTATVSGATVGVAIGSTSGRSANVTNSGTITGPTAITGTGAGQVTITNTGVITGTGPAGIDLTGATSANTINQQAATISGNILFSATADQLTVTGGAIDGNIVGQNLANIDFSLGAGAFTFAAPFAISGVDDIAVHSGLVTMDGAFNARTLTVDGGRLTVNSLSTATNGSTVGTGGILAVDGTLNGAANVLSGGVLAGTGTIGGDVVVADGGAIDPGDGGNGAGTLTIGGSLTLNAGSSLNYNFGQANVAGGALNDLINVGGNLVLDGTLTVTATVGGSFGPGIYRVFNYSGALTDNGLDVTSTDYIVQTSVANQVNLINTGGLVLSYWDGDLGPKFNGVVNGGDGSWRATGDDNWTDVTGTVNGPVGTNPFAIFAGATGTVTVDDSQGAVTAIGMQFATNGYLIQGAPLTLVDDISQPGVQSIIRVGDGTGAGAGFVATISANLIGTSQLVKTDLGTLVLSGANDYTGGTAIDGGTLQVAADANLGDAAGALAFDGGTLRNAASFTSSRAVTLGAGGGTLQTDADLTLAGAITGPGTLTKTGATALVLTGNSTYTGGTTITAGTLQLGSGGTSGSITGNIANDGTLAFDRSDTLTFAGVISGSGGVNQIGTGTTVLTGNSTYTGGTTITAGTLQLGNGGTSGSIADNIANDGTLAFNRSDTLTFAGVISGSGGVNQIGTGTTVLTGNNTYAGPTNVLAGTLLVNGDQSGATGLTSVGSGGTLGGTGTVGGDVTVASGGALSPGGSGNVAGTLTIKGALALSSGSRLNYNFGQANVVGGALNDLINVGGNLVLDGTLNVTATSGGSFGPGIYRVMNYTGTLTDNGLDVTSPDYSVQTSIANQINLINTATGQGLSFWDDGGPHADGTINGGDGVWQSSAGNHNWTDASGTATDAYADGAFAIFAGKPGTVTLDDSLGQVTSSGMQFAVDGYLIQGNALTLLDDAGQPGLQTFIRVGDGTAAGAGYVATISSNLTGNTRLVKTDLGTLVLNGDNTYTGGTTINGGTLQVSADANLGAAAGGLSFDGGTLHATESFTSARALELAGQGTFVTDAGKTVTLSGALSGSGKLIMDGAGKTVLTGDGSGYRGTTDIRDGILSVNSSLCGDVNVLSGGRLQGTGTVCDTHNFDGGTVAPGNSIGTLTVAGDYTGTGGTLEMETVLGGDDSPTDLLVVTDNTSGQTNVRIINLGGTGGQTANGIKILDIGGTSDGTFTLIGDYVFQGEQAVVGGAYAYRLYKNGLSTPDDGDWYLRSGLTNGPTPLPLYQPGVPLYEAYAGILQSLNALGTLQQRVGNRSWSEAATPQGADLPGSPSLDGKGIWARIDVAHAEFDPETSTTGTGYDVHTWKLEAGLDMLLTESGTGQLIGGITVHYGSASSDVSSLFGVGSIDATGVGFGGTLTWYGSGGFYVDAQAEATWYDSDLKSATIGTTLADGNDGFGYGLSLEAGQKVALHENWSLTPQAQLAWSSVDFDDFTDPFGTLVSPGNSDSLVGRLGVSLDYENQWNDAAGQLARSHVYGIANLYYDFLDGSDVDVAGVNFVSENQALWGGLGLGGSLDWADGKYSIYGEALARASLDDFGDSNSFGGKLGFRVQW